MTLTYLKNNRWAMPSGLILVGIVIIIMLKFSQSDPNQSRMAPPVVVLSAYKTPLTDNVEALGTAMADESAQITSNASEVIREIHFRDGQTVEKGEVLVVLEQQEEQAQLAAAKAQLEEHEREQKRLEQLLKSRAAARKEYDERKTRAEITRRQIEEIEARIADRTLHAPFTGILGVRKLSVGSLMQAGEPITTLDQIDPIKLDFNVPSIHLAFLKPGLEIEAQSDSFPGRTFHGEVSAVNNRIDPVTRSILVRAIIPNPEHKLKPGLLMTVSLLENSRDALIVPEESIIQRESKHLLMLVDAEDKVIEREVEIGQRRPGIVEITKGLQPGEQVIVRGMDNVRPGQQVTIQQRWDKMQDSQFNTTGRAS